MAEVLITLADGGELALGGALGAGVPKGGLERGVELGDAGVGRL